MADSVSQLQNQGQNGAQNAVSGEFFVKTLTGKSISITLDPNMTIGMVKQKVFECEAIPVDQQRLIFQGKQLDDNQTIGSYAISADNTLHLVLRLRGGDTLYSSF